MRTHTLAIIVSALFGFLVWALSPSLAGTKEPWDSEYPFYAGFLITGGALVSIMQGKLEPLCFLGVWAGQILALSTLPWLDRSWLAFGVFTTGLGSLLVMVGSSIGCVISRSFRAEDEQVGAADREERGR